MPRNTICEQHRHKLHARSSVMFRLLFHREDVEADPAGESWWQSVHSTWGKPLSVYKNDWSKNMWGGRKTSSMTFNKIAYERFLIAAKFISSGKLAVVDRLHGHILATLLGVPHILIDNSIGKLSAYHGTWTKGCGLGQLAESTGQAEDMAKGFFGLS